MASTQESCQNSVARIGPKILGALNSRQNTGSLKSIQMMSIRMTSVVPYEKSHLEPYNPDPDRGNYNIVDLQNIKTKEWTRVAAPENWRNKHIEMHKRIWKLSREAINGKNVQANVSEILKYLDQDADADALDLLNELHQNPKTTTTDEARSFYDVAERALGEIQSPLAANKLMEVITADADKQRKVSFADIHNYHFWATQALGNLNYSKDETLRVDVETFLLKLASEWYSTRKTAFSGMDALSNESFDTPKVREFLGGHLTNQTAVDWDIYRVFLTWQDPKVVPLLLSTLNATKLQPQSFEHAVTLLSYYRKGFKDLNLNPEDVFQQAVAAWDNSSTGQKYLSEMEAYAFATLIPDKCLPN
jgi:hypothetical protein